MVVTVQPQRNPAAYRRKIFEAQRDVARKAAAAIVTRKAEVRQCYLDYRPPQVRMQRPMQKCLALGPVLPVFRGRTCES